MEVTVWIEARQDEDDALVLVELTECLPVDHETEDGLAALGSKIEELAHDAVGRAASQVMQRRDQVADSRLA